MRLKILFLSIALGISACTFEVAVETPGPETSLPLLPSSSATPQPSPVFTEIASPTQALSVPTAATGSPYQIQFAPNATWQDLVDSIDSGSSKTYLLDALAGQVMSISILPEISEQQGAFQLEIRGQDGVVLCPVKDYECAFWRGVLPSSQGYFITVTAQASSTFTLHVVINPPGVANQHFDYKDSQGRFTLSYTDYFVPAHYIGGSISKFEPELTLEFIDSQQYVQTNLSEAYFLFGLSDDPQQVSTCTQPVSLGGPEAVVGEVEINGIKFTRSEAQGVGAGNIYEQIYHRAAHNGVCYEITFFIHYTNIGNYAAGTVKEFDRAALLQKFEVTLSTLIAK
jgi:hypothetical protein